MLEIDFLFKNNTDKFRKKIEKIFEKCRPFSVEESGGNVKFTFGSEMMSWGNIWAAVWTLTERSWFVRSVEGWEITVHEQGESFSEDLLAYCRKNGKGKFLS